MDFEKLIYELQFLTPSQREELLSLLHSDSLKHETEQEIRRKGYLFMLNEYGRIIERELKKNQVTLAKKMAEGLTYQEFLNREKDWVLSILDQINPGPSFFELIFNKNIQDGAFDDFTAKNLILSLKYRFENFKNPKDQASLKQGLDYLKRIQWEDYNFAVRERGFLYELVESFKREFGTDSTFFRRIYPLMNAQSTEIVVQINDFAVQRLGEMLDEEKKLKAELIRKQLEIKKELSIARKIQGSILPRSFPMGTGLQFFTRYIPVTSVGGDFYDFALIPEVSGQKADVGFFIADVSGHGIPAALIAMMAKIAWQNAILHHRVPSDLLNYLNTVFMNKTSGHFLTAFYGVYNPNTSELSFAFGGHTRPLLLKHTGELEILEGRGRLLGLFPEIVTETKTIKFLEGDRLVMYTDGLLEARNQKFDLFGMENCIQSAKTHFNKQGDDFLDHILDDMSRFTGGIAPEDDVTMVVIDAV